MKYLNVDEVSQLLNIGKRTTYKLFHQNDFPKIQIGRLFFVEEEDLYKYLKHYTYKKIEI